MTDDQDRLSGSFSGQRAEEAVKAERDVGIVLAARRPMMVLPQPRTALHFSWLEMRDTVLRQTIQNAEIDLAEPVVLEHVERIPKLLTDDSCSLYGSRERRHE